MYIKNVIYGRLLENEKIEAAEDLSMASKIAKDVIHAGPTNLELPVKTEYPRLPVKEEYRSR